MATPTRIQIAKADIYRHFDELSTRVFKEADLSQILEEQRGFWRLARRTNTAHFIDFLVRSGRLMPFEFKFPKRSHRVYAWGEVPLIEVVLSLRPRSFLSYYTAVRIHGLTEQVPQTLYVTYEQSRYHIRAQGTLTQEAIDAAFQKPERYTSEIAEYQGTRICLINGVATDFEGVIQMPTTSDTGTTTNVWLTNLERTLIDITVRPGYAGGVAEVLKAFQEARNRISSNRLRAILQSQQYVYPFHQAIGFYMARAGYSHRILDLFRQIPRPLRFYLAHGMAETEFIPEWNLFVPKGL